MTMQARSASKQNQADLFSKTYNKGISFYADKINFEASVKKEHSKTITTMEYQEQELIMRLKNTHAQVNQAQEDFERALTVEEPGKFAK